MTSPFGLLSVTIVLLKVARMVAIPVASTTFLRLRGEEPAAEVGLGFANGILLYLKSLLLCFDLLETTNRPTLAFASARIGSCSLTSNRESFAMTKTPIATNIHQPFDV